MADGLIQVHPLWALLATVLVLAVAWAAAATDAVLAGRGTGQSPTRLLAAPGAEVARLLRQRRRSTPSADHLLWQIGLAGPLVIALLMVAVVPFGRWTLADLGVGIVWFNAMDVFVWAAIWLAGWGANSAHSLVGGYRFLGIALAYELPMMFALTTPAVAAQSLNLGEVVAAQEGLWFVVLMPVAFGVFCIGVLGFAVHGPLAQPFGADLAGGVLVDVSGVDRLLLLLGRYALLAAGSAFGVTMFLGGGTGPLLPGWVWLLVKTLLLVVALLAVARLLPTLRAERFAEIGWVVLLPAALAQVLVVSILVLR